MDDILSSTSREQTVNPADFTGAGEVIKPKSDDRPANFSRRRPRPPYNRPVAGNSRPSRSPQPSSSAMSRPTPTSRPSSINPGSNQGKSSNTRASFVARGLPRSKRAD
ncbi:MAG: hypothetical protein AAB499_01660, partial [Patescibacteria group bacterium]